MSGMGDAGGGGSKGANEAAKLAKDAVDTARAVHGDVSAMWSLLRRRGMDLAKVVIALILIVIQVIATLTGDSQQCGAGGGDPARTTPGYQTTSGGGGVDMNIVKIAYDAVKKRYGDTNNPDANRVLLATFETALAESNFQNLKGGDRDSVGVMQQRASWGSFSQRTDPAWSINKFLSALESKRKDHPNYEAHQLAQATQVSWCDNSQPAAAYDNCHGIYGGNYKSKEAQAKSLIEGQGGFFTVTGTGTISADDGSGAVTPVANDACNGEFTGTNLSGQKNVKVNSPRHGTFTIDVIPDGPRGQVISAAMTQLGVTYVFGGNNWKDDGESDGALDCSSLVMNALKKGAGIELPRTAKEQYNAVSTHYTSKGQMLPGDLIWWSKGSGSAAYHVAIYLGMGTVGNSTKKIPLMLAAPRTGDVVKVQPYYEKNRMYWGNPGYSDTSAAAVPKAA